MEIKAFKMDGLGNDFVIIDRRKNPVSVSKEKIIELGKRDNIGFDQMIFIDELDHKTPNYNPITIFNSDGDKVTACGNGSRCVAKILFDENKKEDAVIVTSNRILEAKKLKPINTGDTELKKAMKLISETGKGPQEQFPSMGCSIKWFK